MCSSQFNQQMILEGKIASTHVQIHTDKNTVHLNQDTSTQLSFQDAHAQVCFCPSRGGWGSAVPGVLHEGITVFHQEAQVSRVSVTDKLGVSQVNR